MRGLYWFRNDLRLADNPVFNRLTELCSSLLCVYIVDERWFSWIRYHTKPLGAFRALFIKQSLADLKQTLAEKGQKLIILSGKPDQLLADLIDTYRIELIGVTRLPATYERRQLRRLMTAYPEKHLIIEGGFTLFSEQQLPFLLMNLPDQFTPFRKLVENISVINSIEAPKKLPVPVRFEEQQTNRLQEITEIKSSMGFMGGYTAG